MCGIAGLSLANDHALAREVIQEMLERIQHRGPDSAGYVASPCNTPGSVHLGFRRLAIRDLDPRANQPMLSASGRTAIVFNGEVYNSEDIAQRYLTGMTRRTTGDTEVIVEAIERHGIQIVERFNGMFGLAVLDISSGQLWLVRDRMGKKPVYLYQQPGFVAFASELRCLKPFGLQIEPRMAELFLHFGYVPSPYTFFAATTQVEPGEIVEVAQGKIVGRRYFHRFANQVWCHGELELDQVDTMLHDAVQLRKISDVPLGAFLSGGVDSALVAANLRTAENNDNTPTFTVAFAEQAHDEADAAAETARELGVSHTVIPINEGQLNDLATDFFDCYEQPYADTSGLVTMLLCRAVRQHVTVALSGDGGDEFYGGYARYEWFRKALWAQRTPAAVRRIAAGISRYVDGRRGPRIARWLSTRDPSTLYTAILCNWTATEFDDLIETDAGPVRPEELVRNLFDQVNADPLSQAACFDATYYIPDDLQVKLDRASMQVALEVRCPLLDYRFASLGMALPSHIKYRQGLKSVLKRCLSRHVSPRVLQRPKHGFNVPLAQWLCGPLRELVQSTLEQQAFGECGWVRRKTVMHVWQRFLDGQNHYAHSVWMLLNLAHHATSIAADRRYTELADSMHRRTAA